MASCINAHQTPPSKIIGPEFTCIERHKKRVILFQHFTNPFLNADYVRITGPLTVHGFGKRKAGIKSVTTFPEIIKIPYTVKSLKRGYGLFFNIILILKWINANHAAKQIFIRQR